MAAHVVLGRAMGFQVAEAACCLVLAKSTENPEKRMLAMQREQRALLEVQRFERIAALERRMFEHAFAAFDQVEQQLGVYGLRCSTLDVYDFGCSTLTGFLHRVPTPHAR